MQPPKESAAPIEVLVVEDSPLQAEVLRRILLKRDYTVRVAPNGVLGLEEIRAQKPALVISDVDMPEMDGYELCQTIKSNRGLRDIPVILLTSLTDPDEILQGLHAKADNYVTKPYDEAVLFSRIDHLLLNRQLRRKSRRGGVEVYRTRHKHTINSNPEQILDLLMSSIDNALLENKKLKADNDRQKELVTQLQAENRQLQLKLGLEEP